MQQADLFLIFTAPLDAAQVAYMVSGSVASMVYGDQFLRKRGRDGEVAAG
jgi:hypothetical protein